MGSFIEKQKFPAHFYLLYLFYCSLVIRRLFTSGVFILFLSVAIGPGSCNIYIRKTYMHVSQGSTLIMFELIPPQLNRRHQLCISVKLVGQIPLLLNPDIVLLFFIKVLSSHSSDVISNAYFLDNVVRDLSIMRFSIVILVLF